MEKMAGLVASSEAEGRKLHSALGLILHGLPFDEALFYRADENTGGFILKATRARGEGGGERGAALEEAGEGAPAASRAVLEPVAAYGPGEGLAGLARKSGAPVKVQNPGPGETMYRGVEDWGMRGFRSVFVFPLLEGIRCYGVLYLKALESVAPGLEEEAFLRVALSQLVSIVKFSEIIDDCREAVLEAEAARERLADAEKLLLLGDIAASLAHEIKNPLLCLGGFAARIRRKLDPSSPVMADVVELTKAVKRLEGVINAMVAPLKKGVDTEEVNDLNDVIDAALKHFDEEMKSHCVDVVCEFFSGPLPVRAGRQELKIIFDNLIANAIQCMDKKEGGTLRLATAMDGDWVVAEVSDSGGGIDPRDVAYIFRPFFTTKKDGTGLGLPITSSIVSRHRGEIDVINRVGDGVTFKVKLPPAGEKKGDAPLAQR